MAISANVISSLSSALASLTPAALKQLGNHLTTSNEMAAMSVLDAMAANPTAAPALLPELTAIPNLPPTVMNWVNQAIANPASFANNITQAKNALLTAVTSTSVLGGIFG